MKIGSPTPRQHLCIHDPYPEQQVYGRSARSPSKRRLVSQDSGPPARVLTIQSCQQTRTVHNKQATVGRMKPGNGRGKPELRRNEHDTGFKHGCGRSLSADFCKEAEFEAPKLAHADLPGTRKTASSRTSAIVALVFVQIRAWSTCVGSCPGLRANLARAPDRSPAKLPGDKPKLQAPPDTRRRPVPRTAMPHALLAYLLVRVPLPPATLVNNTSWTRPGVAINVGIALVPNLSISGHLWQILLGRSGLKSGRNPNTCTISD